MIRLINADALMEKSFEIEYADGWHKSVIKCGADMRGDVM